MLATPLSNCIKSLSGNFLADVRDPQNVKRKESGIYLDAFIDSISTNIGLWSLAL